MKILFVTLIPFDANSSAMIRNRALIHGFLENGYSVDMIAMGSLDNSYSDPSIILNHKNLKLNIIKTLKVYKAITNESKSFLGLFKKKIILPILRYLYHKLSFYDSSIFLVNKINKNLYENEVYDFVVSSSDPKTSHIAVLKMINNGLRYKKWIQYWGDPLALDITDNSFIPKFYKQIQERKILQNADRIIYVSPLTLNEQKKIFKSIADEMAWLPMPYVKEQIYDNKKINPKLLKLGYFGDYKNSVRNIENLYTTCKEENLNLIIAGSSDKNYSQTKTIKIYDRLPKTKIDELINDIDILVCILNKKGTQIPGKIYHYASTNKPILIILDGEHKDEIYLYLSKFERFIFCDNSAKDIKKCLANISPCEIASIPLESLKCAKISVEFLQQIKKEIN